VAWPWLAARYREGYGERMGRYPVFPPEEGKPLWVHAVSVGEVQAAWPLVRTARREGWDSPVLLTTITSTGRKMAEDLVGSDADLMAYYPWDAPWVVDRAIGKVCPAAFVTVETEIWPNFIFNLEERGIPAFIVNGRFSERSFLKAMKSRDFWREVLSSFRLIMVRGDDDASRLAELGVDPSRVVTSGDCKVDALLLRREASCREKLPRGPVLLAGSTHPGEEREVLEAFRQVRQKFPGAVVIIAPRHPERASEVASLAREYGNTGIYTDRGEDRDIMIVDRVGVLFDLYGLADTAFVGGSLVPRGGQNILEPAVWGVPFAHGPHMEDFASHAKALGSLGASRMVRGSSELAREWERMISGGGNPGLAGRKYVESLGGASALAWNRISDILKGRE